MKGTGKSFGAITIVSAIASHKGCALGIDLPVEATVRLEKGNFKRKTFVDFCIQEVFSYFSVSFNPYIEINSSIPVGRGLKSSSAVANAVICAGANALGEFLEDEIILKMNVSASRKAGVSITGALDDAAACYFGGVVFTDNKKDRILKREQFPDDLTCVIYVPEVTGFTRDLNPKLEYIRNYSHIIDSIFSLAYKGNIFEAMTLNGLVYSPILGYSTDKILKAVAAGARASSLSGTGSAVAALVSEKYVKDVNLVWENQVITTDIRRGPP